MKPKRNVTCHLKAIKVLFRQSTSNIGCVKICTLNSRFFLKHRRNNRGASVYALISCLPLHFRPNRFIRSEIFNPSNVKMNTVKSMVTFGNFRTVNILSDWINKLMPITYFVDDDDWSRWSTAEVALFLLTNFLRSMICIECL